MAIRIEENGVAVYRSAIEKISNPALVSLLKFLIRFFKRQRHLGSLLFDDYKTYRDRKKD